MVDQPLTTPTRRNKRVLIAFGILGLIVVVALVGRWAYLMFSGHDTAGLEGTWRDKSHSYEFQPNGDLATRQPGNLERFQVVVEQDRMVCDLAAGRKSSHHSHGSELGFRRATGWTDDPGKDVPP